MLAAGHSAASGATKVRWLGVNAGDASTSKLTSSRRKLMPTIGEVNEVSCLLSPTHPFPFLLQIPHVFTDLVLIMYRMIRRKLGKHAAVARQKMLLRK
jgi:hypothetical protein